MKVRTRKSRPRRAETAVLSEFEAARHQEMLQLLSGIADRLQRFTVEAVQVVERFRRTPHPDVFNILIDPDEFIIDESFRWPLEVAGQIRFFEFSRMYTPDDGVRYWVRLPEDEAAGKSALLQSVQPAEILGVADAIREIYRVAADFGLIPLETRGPEQGGTPHRVA